MNRTDGARTVMSAQTAAPTVELADKAVLAPRFHWGLVVATNTLPVPSDLQDIKPPVHIPTIWPWVWAGLAVLGIALLAWWLLRRRRADQTTQAAAPPVPPHVRARAQLQEALELIDQPRPFCILVSDTIRQYLEGRFDLHAPDRTTEEFLEELQASALLSLTQKQTLGDFLQRCDLVKFARYLPDRSELTGLHDVALRLISETEPAPAPALPTETAA